MTCQSAPIGFGITNHVGVLPGDCVLPATPIGDPGNVITAAGAAAKSVGSAVIAVAATPANVIIPVGQWLEFTSPTGAAVPVRVSTEVPPAATGIPVDSIPIAIADQSTSLFPSLFGGRTAANIDYTTNTVTASPFEQAGFVVVNATTQQATLGWDGLFNQLDAGLWTAFDALINNYRAAGWVTRPPEGTQWAQGTQFRGEIVFTGISIPMPSDGLLNFNVSAQFTGKPDNIFSLATP